MREQEKEIDGLDLFVNRGRDRGQSSYAQTSSGLHVLNFLSAPKEHLAFLPTFPRGEAEGTEAVVEVTCHQTSQTNADSLLPFMPQV